MIGKQRSGITYYRCKTTHADPRTQERFPDHPNTVSVREDVLHAAVEGFFTRPHVRQRSGGAPGPALQRGDGPRPRRAHPTCRRPGGARVTAAEQAKRRLVREIESLPDDDEMAQAMRADIRDRYYQQESERRALLKELDELRAEAPPAPEDPSLLDELPLIPVALAGVPEEPQHALFDAFGLVVQYDQLRSEVQVSVTLTDRLARPVRPAPGSDGGAPEGAVLLPSALLLTPTLPREGQYR